MHHPGGPHRPTGNQDHSEEKEENEVPDEPSTRWSWVKTPAAWPHQRNSEPDQCSCTGQRLQLMGTFLHEILQLLQLLGMWGHTLSVMDGLPWWVSPLRYGDFIPLCSFLEQQKGTFLSLSPIITFLCSPGVRISHQWARDIGLHLT